MHHIVKRSELTLMPKFFDRYITLIDENVDLISGLEESKDDFERIKIKLIEYQDYRYQPNKWTPKDIMQHVIDNERIQTYRALAFARGDTNILPGYDEKLYANNTDAANRTIEDLLKEFQIVRKATLILFQHFTPDQFHKMGICFEVKVTPLALGFQIIGHAKHHLNILNERYFQVK